LSENFKAIASLFSELLKKIPNTNRVKRLNFNLTKLSLFTKLSPHNKVCMPFELLETIPFLLSIHRHPMKERFG